MTYNDCKESGWRSGKHTHFKAGSRGFEFISCWKIFQGATFNWTLHLPSPNGYLFSSAEGVKGSRGVVPATLPYLCTYDTVRII